MSQDKEVDKINLEGLSLASSGGTRWADIEDSPLRMFYSHLSNHTKATNDDHETQFTQKEDHKAVHMKPNFVPEVNLNEKMNDPNNVLYSGVDSFEKFNIRSEIMKGILVKFKAPSRIQALTLPTLLNEYA
jgi:hypothetical protein